MRMVVLAVAAATFCCGAASAAPSIERGDYLVNSIGACGSCHTPLGPQGFDTAHALSGRVVEDSAAFTAIAPNITPAGRVSGWSDAELRRAIREGIRPDGSVIGPPMPFEVYKGLSDTDVASIVMYLRTVPAVQNDPGRSSYHIPLPPAWGPPVTSVADIAEGATAEYGAYLAGPAGHCIVCHTPLGPDGAAMFETALGAGGNSFAGPWGTSVSANLTPTGIGKLSDDELRRMITKGIKPDGTPLMPPMAFEFYDRMKADDVSAIIAYLRTLPPKP
jgi:mono/diheme cytochrome c family protein